jgi:hypothetical protein
MNGRGDEGMFKKADEYTVEEFWKITQGALWGSFWTWYRAIRNVVGKEKADEVLVEQSRLSDEGLAVAMRDLLGKDFENVEEMSEVIEVFHKAFGFMAPWTMETKFKGTETIGPCQYWELCPEEFRAEKVCKIWCKGAAEFLYCNLHPSKPKVIRDSYIPDGAPSCRITIDMEEPQ